VVGILCIAIIIAIVFLCWGLFLLLLKCTGKNRVGFLSGAPYEAQINGQPNPRFRRGRIVFGFSSVMFIVSILVLVFAGLGNLESSREVIAEGATVRVVVSLVLCMYVYCLWLVAFMVCSN